MIETRNWLDSIEITKRKKALILCTKGILRVIYNAFLYN